METLLTESALSINVNVLNTKIWKYVTNLLKNTFVPMVSHGTEWPCEEKDYREYRQSVDQDLRNVASILQQILDAHPENDLATKSYDQDFEVFLTSAIIVCGEHSEQSIWDTEQSVSIASEINAVICKLCKQQSVSDILVGMKSNNETGDIEVILELVLVTLRSKLMKDTWKCYPAAVTCYKWILHQIKEPKLSTHIESVIPTALIILDDYVVENRLTGIQCIQQILKHSHMVCSPMPNNSLSKLKFNDVQQKRELVDKGYAEVIYDVFKRLTLLREKSYIVPLYSCIAELLSTVEYCSNTNSFEWTRRDDILMVLLDNIECEQDSDRRNAYMTSLANLLTNIGCAKWCQRLSKILCTYCEYHVELKTLNATMEVVTLFINIFEERISAYCTDFYTALLKLHMNLTEELHRDEAVLENIETVIAVLYKLKQSIGEKILRDDRTNKILNERLQHQLLGNPDSQTKHCKIERQNKHTPEVCGK